MNIVMASLATQLLVYSAAWLLMGYGFQLKRKVALLWAAGWFAGACCSLLVYLSGPYIAVNIELAINLLLACCFLLLRQGVDVYTGHTSPRWEFVGVLGGMLAVEMLRQLGADWMLPRVGLFSLIVCWPLGATVWQMFKFLRQHHQNTRRQILLIVSPLLVTMALFAIRFLLAAWGGSLDSMQFNQGTAFDLSVTLVLLVMLGSFNFSLASLVLGEVIERLRTLSHTDQLTGLANRRVMMRRLDEEHARCQRGGQRYSVIMLDLDYFKRVNDTHGHTVGDQVLQGVAQVFRNCQRATDTLARTGGEEFMLLLPMTDEAGATVQAQRICQAVRDARLPSDVGPLSVTVSLGLASVLAHDTSANAVVTRADAALYQAKAAGRDRVVASIETDAHL